METLGQSEKMPFPETLLLLLRIRVLFSEQRNKGGEIGRKGPDCVELMFTSAMRQDRRVTSALGFVFNQGSVF